jgi:hypothetical protein
VLENGRYACRYRGAASHTAADRIVLDEWLERDRQVAASESTEGS